MVNLEEHIKQVLKRHPATTYFVACSGGVDSTVLLEIVHRLELPVEIAHVNYGLRGQDSEADEQLLRDLAEKRKIPIHVHRVDLNKQLEAGGNLQQEARNVRYAFFKKLLSKQQNSLVLLAHQQEDQTETFFMNLMRDSGVMGLAAMPEKRGMFVRPMLDISKADIVEYAEQNKTLWREDITNATTKYTRNRWRNEVLPQLRKAIPSLDASVATLVRGFQEKQADLEQLIRPLYSNIQTEQQLSAERFHALDMFEKIELCRQLGQPFGLLSTWEELNHKGTTLVLQTNDHCPFHTLVFDGDRYSFLLESETDVPELTQEVVSSLPNVFNKHEIYLDRSKINGTLKVRKPQTGDRIQPIGMKGSRLVSDVISDAKLDSLEKQRTFVVCDEQHILWVPGLSVSRHAVADPTTSDIVKVSLLQ